MLLANLDEGEYSILWSPVETPAHAGAIELQIVSDDIVDGVGTVTVMANRGVVRYGLAGYLYVTQGELTSESEFAATLLLEEGKNAVVLTAPLADSGDRITAIPDLEGGDQLAWFNVQGGTIDDVVVAQDGSFAAEESVTAFDVEAHDGTGWGDSATQYTDEPVEDPLTLTDFAPSTIRQGQSRSFTATGTGFESGLDIEASGTGVTFESISVDSDTTITGTVVAAGDATLGARDITVTQGEDDDTLVEALEVLEPAVAPSPAGADPTALWARPSRSPFESPWSR